ncbi:cold shock domain-containing protein [Streptomyces sp. LX-29]|uniref:cold-shock protein n=1 Tax=Streptomyces sp. LX-29 TaxID=2900152 RepID=UPI00240D5750|nr:cold shock domain-containing protein [Streptomyces sp. LX-29]WFB10788.1 cold shock domain-containing protein [Streptomyces sp. LX-29]
MATATGKVLNFDEFRGYGFISSTSASEDVFMHVNDLLDDKSLLRPGVLVEFEIDTGDRGLKASSVRILDRSAATGGAAHATRRAAPAVEGAGRQQVGPEDEPLCDVLSEKELLGEVTEAFLKAAPELTAAQILLIRQRVLDIARSHNWVEP